MQHAHLVDGAQRRREFFAELYEICTFVSPRISHVRLEGRAVNELRDDENLVVLSLGVEDLGHILAVNALKHANFAAQSLTRCRVRRHLGMQEFQGNLAPVGVDSLIHRGHAAGADSFHDLISADR